MKVISIATVLVAACSGPAQRADVGNGSSGGGGGAAVEPLRAEGEVHLTGIKQLTRGAGENAEAYWSSSGRELIFQSSRPPYGCDQIYRVPIDGSGEATLVSTGKGRTTCSYFFPGDKEVLYSSTHLAADSCPPPPDHSQGYVWALYDSYDVFTARPDGTELKQLTKNPGYDAESTVCPVDGSIVFTSTRDGDLELYRMDKDGSNVVRLTNSPGYDGGAFFSRDCKQLVWRASRPQGKELADYQRLLKMGLVRPTQLELWVGNADGSEARQVTYLGAASFAPYFTPDSKRILFSSNYPQPRGREFDIWAIDVDGTHLERITFAPGFDGFPMFSPDGTRLAFASNRNQKEEGQTDVYVATWVDKVATRPGMTPTAADRYAADVAWLADDAREGRGVGTQGIDVAADWLAEKMRAVGAEGAFASGSFFQPLDVPIGVKVAPGTTLTVDGAAVAAADFVPAGFSGQVAAKGKTVAMGYGIAAKELGYDDWGAKQAKGKIVVVRRFVPEHKAFLKREEKTRHGDIHKKATIARQRGAVGLIVVDAPATGGKQQEEAPLPAILAGDLSKAVGIPVVVVKRAAGEKLLSGSHQVAIDVKLAVEKKATRNVVGVIRAAAPDKLPGVVVVGAHYDHLGFGGEDALDPGVNAPHNGADDNASGTAALLEIGRTLGARKAELKRDVYLAAFTAEELGLVGSKHFVEHLPPGRDKGEIVGMVNLDMVGRLRAQDGLMVSGTDTAPEWKEMAEPACTAARADCRFQEHGGFGPSDHSSFYAEKVPVLYFFTGNQEDYHKATDDAERINAGGGVRAAMIAADVAARLAARDGRLTYKSVPDSRPRGDRRTFNASLGTIPSYTASPPGVVLDGVRPDGAAAKAGLQKGDRILKIGKIDVASVMELVYILDDARPGQKTTITFERNKKLMTVEAVFGKGRGRGAAHPGPEPSPAPPPK
jgi:Tol biopolymer transport system component